MVVRFITSSVMSSLKEEEFWGTEKDALGLNIVVKKGEQGDTVVTRHDVASRRKNKELKYEDFTEVIKERNTLGVKEENSDKPVTVKVEVEYFRKNDEEDVAVKKERNTFGVKMEKSDEPVTVKVEVESFRMKDEEEDIPLKEEEDVRVKEEKGAFVVKMEKEQHVRMKKPHRVKEKEQQISMKLKNKHVVGVTEKKRELWEKKLEHDVIKTKPSPPSIHRDMPGIMRRAAGRLKIPYPPAVKLEVSEAITTAQSTVEEEEKRALQKSFPIHRRHYSAPPPASTSLANEATTRSSFKGSRHSASQRRREKKRRSSSAAAPSSSPPDRRRRTDPVPPRKRT
ncbi:hypothetical protein UPYG_G00053620 [Umbra pygmaea]|uniref:Uncharacterized protein n=1 Tax=Umbra pygmaea TaxID=75934 RepID=A0ABD0X7Q6_UMBPY